MVRVLQRNRRVGKTYKERQTERQTETLIYDQVLAPPIMEAKQEDICPPQTGEGLWAVVVVQRPRSLELRTQKVDVSAQVAVRE